MVGARPCRTRPDVSVGKVLQEARYRQGARLEQVADELRVPIKHLIALEEGDLSVFTAEIYARGAFHKYANYLGVAAEPYNRAFQRMLCGAREMVPLRLHTPRSRLQAMLGPKLFLAGALTVLAMMVGGYVVWQVTSFVRLPALALISPEAGVVAEDVIKVSGMAAEDAEVTINGEQVLLAESGRFETILHVHPGINVLQVKATNAAGRSRVIEKDVLMSR
jgi:cytoskeletal protein RodZ